MLWTSRSAVCLGLFAATSPSLRVLPGRPPIGPHASQKKQGPAAFLEEALAPFLCLQDHLPDFRVISAPPHLATMTKAMLTASWLTSSSSWSTLATSPCSIICFSTSPLYKPALALNCAQTQIECKTSWFVEGKNWTFTQGHLHLYRVCFLPFSSGDVWSTFLQHSAACRQQILSLGGHPSQVYTVRKYWSCAECNTGATVYYFISVQSNYLELKPGFD